MLYLCVFSLSIVYSIDIGSENVVIGVAVPGKGVSIKPTDRGGRSQFNLFGVCDTSGYNITKRMWCVGSDAQTESIREPNHVVRDPFRFIASKQSFPLDIHPIVASSLAISLFLPNIPTNSDHLVVAVPSFSSPHYRYGIQQSLKLISKASVQIVQQNSAIATLYAIERLNKTMKKTHRVLFIDIGSEHCEICLWGFFAQNGNVKAQLDDFQYTNKINGRLIDEAILKFVQKNLERIVYESEKNLLLQQIKKSKEKLAAGMNFSLDLNESFGSVLNFAPEMIYQHTSPLMDILSYLLLQFKIEPNEIELIGGATRYPQIVETVQSVFKGVSVRRSMNSDDSIALGSAYIGGLHKKMISGIQIKTKQEPIYTFTVKKGHKTIPIIDSSKKLKKHIVFFTEKNDFSFRLVAPIHDNYLPKLESESYKLYKKSFLTIDISGINKTRDVWFKKLMSDEFQVNVSMGPSSEGGLIGIDSVRIYNKVSVGSNDPEEKMWNGDYLLRYENESFNEPPNAREFINQTIKYMKEQRNKQAIIHDLHSFIFESEIKLSADRDILQVSTQEERKNLSTMLNETKLLLSNSSAKNMKKHLERLKREFRDILMRLDEFKERPQALSLLLSSIKKSNAHLKHSNSNDPKRQTFEQYLAATKLWYDNAKSIDPLSIPKILSKDIIRRSNTLLKKLDFLKQKDTSNSEL